MGYYYEGHNINNAVRALDEAVIRHQDNLESYKCGAECVKWRHSPYNPEVQATWRKLLEYKV
jgi:hypothetical protein